MPSFSREFSDQPLQQQLTNQPTQSIIQQQHSQWGSANLNAKPILDHNQLDESISASSSNSTSYNQKTSDRMRQDEGGHY